MTAEIATWIWAPSRPDVQASPASPSTAEHLLATFRFWAFQGIEAGVFIVLAAALVAVAYRMVLARDA